MFGADPRTSGTIKIDGRQADIRCPGDAIARKISLVPEDRKKQGVVLMMNIKENTTLASLKKMTKWGRLNLRQEEEITEEYKEKLHIAAPGIYETVANLSGGNQH